MTRLPIMAELGRGMGWHAGTILAMLWLYLDESGDHDRETGNLVRLAHGGGIARFEAWEALSIEWADTLIRFEVPMFHMADFEARRKPFEGWDNDRRRALLARLMDIALAYIPMFWGVMGNHPKLSWQKAYPPPLHEQRLEGGKRDVVRIAGTKGADHGRICCA